MYFSQVINNVHRTYQQVCDVKLAFIGAQNNNCFSDCCRRSYRMTAQSVTKKTASYIKLLITRNSYILT